MTRNKTQGLFLISILLNTAHLWAQFQAVPLIMKVPIYQSESTTSEILEYKIKGQEFVVYVPDQMNSPFLKTFDSIGRISYVERKNVEIYVNDQRELQWISFPLINAQEE